MSTVHASVQHSPTTTATRANLKLGQIGHCTDVDEIWMRTEFGLRRIYPTGAAAVNFLFSSSAGLALGGQPLVSDNQAIFVSGGLSLGGQAAAFLTVARDVSSGLELGGQAVIAEGDVFTPSAGLALGGKPIIVGLRAFFVIGGLELGGQAEYFRGRALAPAGGLEFGGQPSVAEGVAVFPVGGLALGGQASHGIGLQFLTAGGLGLGGQAAIVLPPPAVVTGVTSPTGNGIYYLGAVITVRVTFDQIVDVTGTPQLTLDLEGGPGQIVDYSAGTGTADLDFAYTVQTGDHSDDLEYIGTFSLDLNGGTINHSGTPADLTLPAPGASGSLGFNQDIIVHPIPFFDRFTDANGTGLGSHVADTEQTWAGTGGAVIQSNKLESTNDTYFHADAGISDGVVTCDVITPASWINGVYAAIWGRASGSGSSASGWVAHLVWIAPTSHAVYLYRVDAGTFVQVATGANFTLAANTTYQLKLTLSGTSITAEVVGQSSANTTSSTYQSNTKVGIRLFVSASSPTCKLDNLQMVQ